MNENIIVSVFYFSSYHLNNKETLFLHDNPIPLKEFHRSLGKKQL